MGATRIEFRLRMAIMAAVITLGFWSPWIESWGPWTGIARRITLLEWLALELSRLGLLRFAVASPMVIVLGALVAAKGVALRVWGAAYLGPGIVNHAEMRAGPIMADGPYRYVRNPLYLGSWCVFTAMAFLMPVSGALFVVVLLTVFLLRLIRGEEAFLSRQLGEPYRAYLRAVPRLLPRWRTGLPRTDHKPRWLHAVLGELNPIGVFITLAFVSWTYDSRLMVRAILVSFGVSLVARALLPGVKQEARVAA